jgi:hypothetical protein
MLGCVNPARCVGHFFLGLDIGPTRTSNRLATALTEAPEIGPWVAAHGGRRSIQRKTTRGRATALWLSTFGLQRTDVGTNVAGDGFMNLPDKKSLCTPFKIELSPEDYWFLRRDVKSAEDVQAMLQAIVDEAIQARRNAQVPHVR